MYTILISILCGGAVGTALGLSDATSPFWAVTWGVLATVATYAIALFLLNRALRSRMESVQGILLEGQRQMQARVKRYESRPGTDPRQAMREMEASSQKVLRAALENSSVLEPFIGWIPLMSRQIATMRMQFHYQLKEFDKVDALLPRCLVLDPLSASMKLAQRWRAKATSAEIRKEFDKMVPRLKYNQSVLPYSLMAWIYVQEALAAEAEARKAPQDRKAEIEARRAAAEENAHQILIRACRDNEHETLNRNRDRLANRKLREFTNAGLADQWYALFLETPKIQQRRVMPRMDGRPF